MKSQGYANLRAFKCNSCITLFAEWSINRSRRLRIESRPKGSKGFQMTNENSIRQILQRNITDNHSESSYFAAIRELIELGRDLSAHSEQSREIRDQIDHVYRLIEDEMKTNTARPVSRVKFGTSGWRGILGKDIYLHSVSLVTRAIIDMYADIDSDELATALGVADIAEARRKGCVVGFDNRFGGELLARRVMDILLADGFRVHYAGESTTGAISASVLQLGAAFSINLTPSHNPLEYGGFKFNASDAGPAASIITDRITSNALALFESNRSLDIRPKQTEPEIISALDLWIDLVNKGSVRHGLDYHAIIDAFNNRDDCVLAIDCVHGASRIHISQLFKNQDHDRLILLRNQSDPTFGGLAPEPSSENMQRTVTALKERPEKLKLGAIIDPDADRIRFTDGNIQIDMNFFGAMAYFYLHEKKEKKGLVAKSVATSNFANAVADKLGEKVFESRVGFKEFKPVIDEALVCFEESDGISVIGHTPEKDAYIGLLLGLDMIMASGRNLTEILHELQEHFGYFYPARDAVVVSQQGSELLETLAGLEKYAEGKTIDVGGETKTISQVIDIDGRKMIMEDGSWLMIRPSGTEPKVRFYVEGRTQQDKKALFEAARNMLAEIDLVG